MINEAALLAARRGLKAITLPNSKKPATRCAGAANAAAWRLSEKEKDEHRLSRSRSRAAARVARTHRAAAQGDDHSARAFARLDHVAAGRRQIHQPQRTSFDRGLSSTMGGRVAEEIVFGDVTNGARGDIKQATGIARRMVCEWGMSEKMGMVEYGEHEDYVFLGRDISRARDYSEATAEQIDREVRKLIDDAYTRPRTRSPTIATSWRSSRRRCSNSRRSMANKSRKSSSMGAS